MTEGFTGETGPCQGLGPIESLRREDVVHGNGAAIADLTGPWERRRRSIIQTYAWFRPGLHPIDTSAISPDPARSALGTAASAGSPDLLTYVTDSDGAPELREFREGAELGVRGGHTGFRSLTALTEGGVALLNPSRYIPAIADVVDGLAMSTGGRVSGLLVSGSIPAGSAAITEGATSAVAPLGATDALVTERDGTGHRVPPGSVYVSDSLTAIEVANDDVALTLHALFPTCGDVWDVMIRTAGHWPRLRADLPPDLDRPAAAYGIDEATTVTPLLLEAVAALESQDTLNSAVAWFGALTRPALNPVPDPGTVPASAREWAERPVRGRFPGGFGYLVGTDPTRRWLTFAGCAVSVDRHLDPLLVALAGGETFRGCDLAVHCSEHDATCPGPALELLYSLGVVDLVQS